MKSAILLILAAACIGGCASQRGPSPTSRPAETAAQLRQRIDQSVARGVEFLVKNQSPDGSWGTGLVTRGFEIYSVMPGSLQCFRVATTALCVMALREAGEKTAHDRGVEYLLVHGQAFRDQGDLILNTWSDIYTIQALAIEMRTNPDPRLKVAVQWHINGLAQSETFEGGWNYYDFTAGAEHPAMGGTSFGTAAGLVALWEARQSGCQVPQGLIDRAIRVLRECRLPNASYLYGVEYRYVPRLPANQPRGTIGRNQSCNFALWLWHAAGIGQKQSVDGLQYFEQEHIFIDIGRQRPMPHETWYQTAPYYYYFGHYYAARIIERLTGQDKERHARELASFILPHQETDGSWWDFAMWDFHKPYGTAYAIMTLLRCR